MSDSPRQGEGQAVAAGACVAGNETPPAAGGETAPGEPDDLASGIRAIGALIDRMEQRLVADRAEVARLEALNESIRRQIAEAERERDAAQLAAALGASEGEA